MINFLIVLFAACSLTVVDALEPSIVKTTDERVREYGYPVEEHTVVTSDGYILTLFRIPYSPKLQNMNDTKAVVFIQHGLVSSSDTWIINGPNDALAFLLADAGYDVWMGNSRGNTYSRRHTSLSPSGSSFWDFSWHEIAIFDLPACIDYVLDITGESSLYYAGHSQGTTIFFVLMSTHPSYNAKIRIGFMLAPIGYMNHARSPGFKILAPFLGHPSIASSLLGPHEILRSSELVNLIGSNVCSDQSPLQDVCLLALFFLAGFDYKYLNYTMLPDIFETYPAGSSIKQGIHYLQEYNSKEFRQYDYGLVGNLHKYRKTSPPDYEIEKITAKVVFHYGANDFFAAIVDVQRLGKRLQNLIEENLISVSEWNHFDFMWSILVKDQVNDKIIKTINDNEAQYQSGKNRIAS